MNAYLRRLRSSLCQPVRVHKIGSSSDFVYSEGILCYLQGPSLRILNLFESFTKEETVDLSPIARGWNERASYRLIGCKDEVVTLRVRSRSRHTTVALTTRHGVHVGKRALLNLPVPRDSFVITRNDSRFLCVGVLEKMIPPHSPSQQWAFSTYDMLNERNCIAWCNLGYFDALNELGTSMTLDVIDGHFWVMTTELTHDREGRDPISYYGGYRYNLETIMSAATPQPSSQPDTSSAEDDFRKPEYWRLERRRQNEGPIHDLWTTLSLHKAEDDTHLILETRREWKDDNPEPIRSFYSIRFSPSEIPISSSTPSSPASPTDQDPIATTSGTTAQDSASSSSYSSDEEDPTQNLIESTMSKLPDNKFLNFKHGLRERHVEPPASQPGTTFGLNETLYRSYNESCDTFLDIVKRPLENQGDAIALRVGCRWKEDVILWPPIHTPIATEETIDIDDDKWTGKEDKSRGIEDKARPLFNMETGLKGFKAFNDERCIVFGVEGKGDEKGIVIVCFDGMMGEGIV